MRTTANASLEGLLYSMREALEQARQISDNLLQFIREESLTWEDARDEWNHIRDSCHDHQVEAMFIRAIERRQAITWTEAGERFNAKELSVLATWMELETQAWILAVGICI